MPRILAIEADPQRRDVLSAFVREHVKADLVVVATVGDAIESINRHTPDLIVAPTLLAPPEEAELRAHMKRLQSAPYIQMVTLPALDMLSGDSPRDSERRLFGSLFGRRPTSLGLQYDRSMVAAQIVDGLARAREQRMEYAAMLAYHDAAAERARAARVAGDGRSALAASDGFIERQLRAAARDERRIALRKTLGDVPWLSGVKLPWGPELQLVNISSTGVLVETGSKFAPGSTSELHLSGPDTSLVVPVRFIRSDVSRIDGLGVRYRAAAAFAKEIDLERPRRRQAPATPPEDLAALLGDALAGGGGAGWEPAHVRFAQGVRRLIGARDVQVRTGSAGAVGGRETLYFDVPGDDRTRTTLQVMFDRGHDVTDEEFRLLKAAAWITAAVLELEKPGPARTEPAPVALLAECVA